MRTAFTLLIPLFLAASLSQARAGGTSFGATVECESDFDGDGTRDLLLSHASNSSSAVVWVLSGVSREPLLTASGPPHSKRYGLAVEALDDLDADGVPDLAVLGAFADPVRVFVDVLSGATGQLLRRIEPDHDTSVERYAIESLGDVDGDGVGDFAIGWTDVHQNGKRYVGCVEARSGKSGAVLWTRLGEHEHERLGRRLLFLPDTPARGAEEPLGKQLVVTSYSGPVVGSLAGPKIDVFDVETGESVAREWSEHRALGSQLSLLADFDGDGVRDYGVTYCAQPHTCGIAVFGGRNHAELRTFVGRRQARFGQAFAALADRDGDGLAELLVGSPEAWGSGKAEILAFESGNPLWSREGPESSRAIYGRKFGSAVAALDDIDGDGVEDFAVGARSVSDAAGIVQLYSGEDATLIQTIRRDDLEPAAD